MEKEEIKQKIDDWFKTLRSGNGDTKIVHVNDFIKLYQTLGVSNEAKDNLLKDLETAYKNVGGKCEEKKKM